MMQMGHIIITCEGALLIEAASNSGSNQLEAASMALVPFVEATTPPAKGKGKRCKRKPTAMATPNSPSMGTRSKKKTTA